MPFALFCHRKPSMKEMCQHDIFFSELYVSLTISECCKSDGTKRSFAVFCSMEQFVPEQMEQTVPFSCSTFLFHHPVALFSLPNLVMTSADRHRHSRRSLRRPGIQDFGFLFQPRPTDTVIPGGACGDPESRISVFCFNPARPTPSFRAELAETRNPGFRFFVSTPPDRHRHSVRSLRRPGIQDFGFLFQPRPTDTVIPGGACGDPESRISVFCFNPARPTPSFRAELAETRNPGFRFFVSTPTDRHRHSGRSLRRPGIQATNENRPKLKPSPPSFFFLPRSIFPQSPFVKAFCRNHYRANSMPARFLLASLYKSLTISRGCKARERNGLSGLVVPWNNLFRNKWNKLFRPSETGERGVGREASWYAFPRKAWERVNPGAGTAQPIGPTTHPDSALQATKDRVGGSKPPGGGLAT